MTVNAVQATTAPDTIDSVLKFRSAPEVPTEPVPTVAEPEVTSAKYPAVLVFPALPEVIVFAAADPPEPLATAFANATASGSGGSAAANTITGGTAGNAGTAGYFALVTSGSATVGTGSVGTSGADLNFNTLSIVAGAIVSCTSFTVTMPQT